MRHQQFFGNDESISRFSNTKAPEELGEVSRAQRRAVAQQLPEYAAAYASRDTAMAHSYRTGAYTMSEIAEYFGVYSMTFSRAVRRHEQSEMYECEN